MASDWLFSGLCLPQTVESSVFQPENQWFVLRTAEHTLPKVASWAEVGGLLALQVGVKSDYLAAVCAFKIIANARRAEQVAFFWGQSDFTSTCLVNFS